MAAKPGATGIDLVKFANYIIEHGPKKVLPASRRVRIIHNHTFVVDTTKAFYVWEHEYYPQFYVPASALQNCKSTDKKEVKDDSGNVLAAVVELTVSAHHEVSETKTDRVLRFADDKKLGDLAGMLRIEFESMDQWLEEDTPIYVHPKDPSKRIEILPSQRRIEVKVGGKTVAESTTAMHLHETGLPTRYYLPLASVDQSVLRKSDLITGCPYKGDAQYYSVVVNGKEHKDVVWYYRLPTHESAFVAGLVCFYNEKVEILVDGVLEEKPKNSPFA